ncbi:MAG: GNAT family N-acetyltransferase [Proteobacteria bacterium]|nr:GNAT family N-acetyltransferase [Pseudomonadota bacterium]
MKVICQEITSSADQNTSLALRRRVFIEEQKVPPDREVDGLDAEAWHFAAKAGDRMIATCRVRLIDKTAKIERVAVLREFRGQGVGNALMRFVMQTLTRTESINLLKLSSQTTALPFYEKMGFKKKGAEYMDAGIPHHDMTLAVGKK